MGCKTKVSGWHTLCEAVCWARCGLIRGSGEGSMETDRLVTSGAKV